MKWKEHIELPSPDPLKAVAKLRKIDGVLCARMIDAGRLSIDYDSRKIQGKKLAKLVRPSRHFGAPPSKAA